MAAELKRVQEHLKHHDVNVIFDHVDSRQQLIKEMMATKAEAELVCHPTYPDLFTGAQGIGVGDSELAESLCFVSSLSLRPRRGGRRRLV